MRVAIVTESFPPDVNGVANSVARVLPHLVARGHQPVVIAPRPALNTRRVADSLSMPWNRPGGPASGAEAESSPTSSLTSSLTSLPIEIIRVPAVAAPRISGVRLALPGRHIAQALAAARADVVHLASPFVLGAWAIKPAGRLDVPVVASYQTDIPGYTRAYGLGFSEPAAWRWIHRIHDRAARTLAPSTSTAEDLIAHGVPRVWLWRRGVDLSLFDPGLRNDGVRHALAPDGETIVGYVGRLATEKQVDLLAQASLLPGVKVVIVGDGPAGSSVRRALPNAIFLGPRYGAQLARLYASFDIFVHTGPYETFCQTVQEAMASGLPVVAPAAGGPRDLVEPDVTGLLATPGSGSSFAAAVAELAGDATKRAEYGRAGWAAVQKRTWPNVVDELIGHYREVLVGERATAALPAVAPTAVPQPAASGA